MRITTNGSITQLWLTAYDTATWATRPGASWPGSILAGKALYAEFDDEDLIDHAIDGNSDFDIPADEFNAITSDFLSGVTQ